MLIRYFQESDMCCEPYGSKKYHHENIKNLSETLLHKNIVQFLESLAEIVISLNWFKKDAESQSQYGKN